MASSTDKIVVVQKFLQEVSWARIIQVVVLSLVLIASLVIFENRQEIYLEVNSSILLHQDRVTPLRSIDAASKLVIDAFMLKYKNEALYMTILVFDFQRNLRTPIFRSFNDDEVLKLVIDRLNGDSGALPIFLKDDNSNNKQIISLLAGELICDPFSAGGLARVWPDLNTKFSKSCRIPIPPSFGNGIRGYMVVHFAKEMTPYRQQAAEIDMKILATEIDRLSRR